MQKPKGLRKRLEELTPRGAWTVLFLYSTIMVSVALLSYGFFDREALRNAAADTGSAGIIGFTIFVYFYVIFVPFFNTPIHLAAGYVFGGDIGWLINFVGTTAGLFTIILLVKRYGRTLLKKIVNDSMLQRYDSTTELVGPLSLFIMYVLPFFPDDEITYILAANKKLSFWRFILPITLGNLTKAAVSYIGDEKAQGIPMVLATRVGILIVGLLIIGIQEGLHYRFEV